MNAKQIPGAQLHMLTNIPVKCHDFWTNAIKKISRRTDGQMTFSKEWAIKN